MVNYTTFIPESLKKKMQRIADSENKTLYRIGQEALKDYFSDDEDEEETSNDEDSNELLG